jgi:kynurenine formamidase
MAAPVESHATGEIGVPEELRQAAREVSNWGKWGADDELGTLNYISPECVNRAASLVKQGRSYNLGIEFDAYGPQGAHGFRRNPIHLMTLDGGDREMVERLGGWGGETEEQISMIWRSPMRFNDDFIIMPLQCATQWDALSHVYYDQQLYNGFSADTCTSLGASKDGIDKVARAGQVVGRGVLLDIARLKGESQLPAGAVVTPDDLDAAAEAEHVEVQEGDIIMVRTGWRQEFVNNRNGETWAYTSPGLSWHCARWLSAHHCAAVACDNIAVETSTVELEGILLPMHMLALRDMGMMLGEMWDFEALGAACADDGSYEFLLVSQPLLITGAVGSPINPIAIK